MDSSYSHDSLDIAVLSGGDSPEREVSLASGICVAAALEQAGHKVRSIDPADIELVDVDWRMFDACYIALHGGAGEDGRVQHQLDELDVAYTGSGSAASALAMTKSAAKRRWLDLGIPTPDFVLWHAMEPIRAIVERAEMLRYPLVVKPDGLGSSLGVQLVHNEDQLRRAAAHCQLYDPCVMVERYVTGREFTVSLIGSRPLPLLEIVSHGQIFTYEEKYHTVADTTITQRFETELSSVEIDRLEQTAVAASEALGTEGLVRVDLMLSEDDEPWVLEVNTSPGMTEESLAPRAAERAGLDLPKFCDYLIRSCIRREVAS